MLSYWERESFSKYDAIVVGGGIVGISTAVALREQNKAQSVLVLERSILPAGASTRNAGFACMGSVTELLNDLEQMTEDEMVSLFEQRKEGLSILRNRLGDAAIGYAASGSYELISHDEKYALGKIDYLNTLLQPVNKNPPFRLANDKIDEFGFDKSYTLALIENIHEGELDTGKMMQALLAYAYSLGVEIKTGAEAVQYEEGLSEVAVEVADKQRGVVTFKSNCLFICTNAFTSQLIPEVSIKPGRGQVLITHPIEGLRFKGIFHFDKGYYYFREVNGRVMLGGGRNLDIDGETTEEMTITDNIQNDLIEKLTTIILPNTSFKVDTQWSGIMAFGEDKQPVVKAFSDRVYGAFGMGGMGVAIGSLAGQQMAGLLNV